MVSAWATGAAINVCGSILINLGTNVMKLGHNRRAACELNIKPPIRSYKSWQLGVVLFIVGNMLNFFSFGFAAQSLLAALGSVQFVSNVFFASAVLGEKVTRRVIFATFCIVSGCVLLISFGNHQSQTLTVSDMLSYYASPIYITFLVLLVIATSSLFFIYHYGQQKLAWMGREAVSDKWVRLLPVTYALFSGMVGTQSVLFCKTLSTLLRTTIAGESQLQSWFFWLTFLFFLATAYFWISRLNLALQLFPAIMIVPMMQISWTLFSILSGGIYFQEYRTMSAASGCGYGLGVTIVFIGVYLLTPSKKAYLRQFGDLESGLAGGKPPGGDALTSPLVDLSTTLNPNHSRKPSEAFDPSDPEASQETASLLGNMNNGGLKGLSGTTLDHRPASEQLSVKSIGDAGPHQIRSDKFAPAAAMGDTLGLEVKSTAYEPFGRSFSWQSSADLTDSNPNIRSSIADGIWSGRQRAPLPAVTNAHGLSNSCSRDVQAGTYTDALQPQMLVGL